MNKAFILALQEYGVKEIVGKKHNPTITNYFAEICFEWIKDDETAWCSAFVNAMCKRADLEMSNRLDARSWLKVGLETKEPQLGDIVVFWRESKSSWKGHVGFFVRETENYIYTLGGNQSNQVKISAYHKSRLLGYRKI